MKRNKLITVAALCGAVVMLGGAALFEQAHHNPRFLEISVFHLGHSHDADGTQGAPSHSGGTDAYGCHNGSVPYHCH